MREVNSSIFGLFISSAFANEWDLGWTELLHYGELPSNVRLNMWMSLPPPHLDTYLAGVLIVSKAIGLSRARHMNGRTNGWMDDGSATSLCVRIATTRQDRTENAT